MFRPVGSRAFGFQLAGMLEDYFWFGSLGRLRVVSMLSDIEEGRIFLISYSLSPGNVSFIVWMHYMTCFRQLIISGVSCWTLQRRLLLKAWCSLSFCSNLLLREFQLIFWLTTTDDYSRDHLKMPDLNNRQIRSCKATFDWSKQTSLLRHALLECTAIAVVWDPVEYFLHFFHSFDSWHFALYIFISTGFPDVSKPISKNI